MRNARWIGLAFVLGVNGVVIGCGGGAATSPVPVTATSTEVDDEATADLKEHHRHHHHGGVPMFVAMSLHSLDINPDQKAKVEKIQADLFAKIEPARKADQDVMNAIADGVAAGTLDNAKIDAAIAQLQAVSGTLHDASIEALNELHATLTKDQRAALVDKVEAHWTVWKDANEGHAGKGGNHAHLQDLSKEIGLSKDQETKIETSLTADAATPVAKVDPQVIEAHVQAFAAAFRSDTFDAKALTQGGAANSHLALWGTTRTVRFVQAALPVLTPEQRTKLAQHIREHANHKEQE